MLNQITSLTNLTNFATILAALASCVAAVFISMQVYIMRRTRQVDTFLKIIDAGNEAATEEAARWVKYQMMEMPYEQARQNHWDKISRLIHHFETVGVLVENRYLSRDLIYDQMGPWVVGSWAKLENIVSQHRRIKKSPDYAENFEVLAAGYAAWAKKHPAKLEKRARASSEALSQYYSKTQV